MSNFFLNTRQNSYNKVESTPLLQKKPNKKSKKLESWSDYKTIIKQNPYYNFNSKELTSMILAFDKELIILPDDKTKFVNCLKKELLNLNASDKAIIIEEIIIRSEGPKKDTFKLIPIDDKTKDAIKTKINEQIKNLHEKASQKTIFPKAVTPYEIPSEFYIGSNIPVETKIIPKKTETKKISLNNWQQCKKLIQHSEKDQYFRITTFNSLTELSSLINYFDEQKPRDAKESDAFVSLISEKFVNLNNKTDIPQEEKDAVAKEIIHKQKGSHKTVFENIEKTIRKKLTNLNKHLIEEAKSKIGDNILLQNSFENWKNQFNEEQTG